MGVKHSEAATVAETETVGEGNREGQKAMGTGPAGCRTVQATPSQTSVREWEPPWHTHKACASPSQPRPVHCSFQVPGLPTNDWAPAADLHPRAWHRARNLQGEGWLTGGPSSTLRFRGVGFFLGKSATLPPPLLAGQRPVSVLWRVSHLKHVLDERRPPME